MKSALLILSLISLTLTGGSVLAEDVRSLRGPVAIDEEVNAPDWKKEHRDQPPIPRNYVQQPPLIPHTTRGYEVTRTYNECMKCHNWKDYRYYEATKVSQTHYTDSKGVELSDMAPRRHFCILCHVTQTEARPLIENDFRAVESLTR